AGQPAVQVDVHRAPLPDLSVVVVVDEAERFAPQGPLGLGELTLAHQQVDVDSLRGRVIEPESDRGALEEKGWNSRRLERSRDLDGDRVEGGHYADHSRCGPRSFHQYWLSVPARRVWSTARRKK